MILLAGLGQNTYPVAGPIMIHVDAFVGPFLTGPALDGLDARRPTGLYMHANLAPAGALGAPIIGAG